MRVTFVCTGNICRSPMAESIARSYFARAKLDVAVDSSGTDGWHVGENADHRAVTTLQRAGYTSNHVARRFDPDWFEDYDLILALDSGHRRRLRALAPNAESMAKIRLLREFDSTATDLDVPDPYYGDLSGFEQVREMIEAAMLGLIAEIRQRTSD